MGERRSEKGGLDVLETGMSVCMRHEVGLFCERHKLDQLLFLEINLCVIFHYFLLVNTDRMQFEIVYWDEALFVNAPQLAFTFSARV